MTVKCQTREKKKTEYVQLYARRRHIAEFRCIEISRGGNVIQHGGTHSKRTVSVDGCPLRAHIDEISNRLLSR